MYNKQFILLYLSRASYLGTIISHILMAKIIIGLSILFASSETHAVPVSKMSVK